MYSSILGLSHLQSVDLNSNYITCTFAKGSNATGCRTVSTCNASVPGKTIASKVSSLIELDPSLSYTTGKVAGVEISDCLMYDVSVYEVIPDSSMGTSAVKVFNNITFLPGSLPTSNCDRMPTPSPSNSTIAPTENCEGIYHCIYIYIYIYIYVLRFT